MGRGWLWLGLAWLLTGCGGGADEAAEAPSRTLQLPLGAEATLAAPVRLLSGEAVVPLGEGRARAVGPGVARLETADGVVEIRVPEPDRLDLHLEPAVSTQPVGGRWRVTLTAVTGTAAHAVDDLVAWEVTGPALRREAAWVVAQAPGEGEVRARWGEWTVARTLSVVAADDPVVGYRLEALDAEGAWPAGEVRRFRLWQRHESGQEVLHPLDDGALQARGPLQWEALEAGLIQLRPTGTEESCLYHGTQALACWTFQPAPLVRLQLQRLDDGSAAVGEELRLGLQGEDALGVLHDLTDVARWTVEGRLLAVLGGGRFRVLAAGETVVRASAEGLEATLSLALQPPRLLELVVSPPVEVLFPGDELVLTVTGRYSDGQQRAVSAPSWFSDAPQVVAVTETGLQAQGPGEARVWARWQGVDSAAVVVRVAEGVVIEPERLDLTAGEQGQLEALAVYGGESQPVPAGARVDWRSSEETVAQVAGGTVTAVTPGEVTIDTLPSAQRPAQVRVRPRWVLQGPGRYLLRRDDFVTLADGRRVAALGMSGLTAGGRYTVRLGQLPAGHVLEVTTDPQLEGSCTNVSLGEAVGCSLETGTQQALVAIVVLYDPGFDPEGVALDLRDGGFYNEGVVQPVVVPVGALHEGSVAATGISRYQVEASGTGRFRLQVTLLEGGPAQLRLGNVDACASAILDTAGIDCSFHLADPDLPLRIEFDNTLQRAPEGGTRFQFSVLPDGAP